MTDLATALEDHVRNLSQLTDEQINTAVIAIDRAYMHTMIEKHLRQSTSVS